MYQIEKCRSGFPQQMQPFNVQCQGSSFSTEGGTVVLSTDPKPRLRWTAELHEKFVDSVTQLGGAEKATPKTVMKVMNVKGLTLYHLKSHLQKYRLGKQSHKHVVPDSDKLADQTIHEAYPETLMTESTTSADGSDNGQIADALGLQIEVQRKLHEQMEVQRLLQVRIEAQGRYLQSILEKAQQTLAGQTVANIGLEAARAELSDLASKVSSECLNPTFLLAPSFSDKHAEERLVPHAEKMVEFSPQSSLTHLTYNETYGFGDKQPSSKKRPRDVAGEYDSRAIGDEDFKQNEVDTSTGGCSSVEERLSSSTCVWSIPSKEHSVCQRGLESYAVDEHGENKGKERGFKSSHIVERPEPRQGGLSEEQVMGLAAYSDRNSMIELMGSRRRASTRMGRGLDLNANGHGHVYRYEAFDLNGCEEIR